MTENSENIDFEDGLKAGYELGRHDADAALGHVSAVLAQKADAWRGNAPAWFPEPPEWLDLFDEGWPYNKVPTQEEIDEINWVVFGSEEECYCEECQTERLEEEECYCEECQAECLESQAADEPEPVTLGRPSQTTDSVSSKDNSITVVTVYELS